MFCDPEPRAHRLRDQTGPCGRTDQREARDRQLNAAGCRALADHNVEFEIFHRRVQMLFGNATQTVNLVDEQHVAFLERVGQDRGQIARFFDGGTAGDFDPNAHFGGDDVRQRGFTQSGRPKNQGVIERLTACFGSLEVNAEFGFESVLTDVILESAWSVRALKGWIGLGHSRRHSSSILRFQRNE
jgi:hypothetical protein